MGSACGTEEKHVGEHRPSAAPMDPVYPGPPIMPNDPTASFRRHSSGSSVRRSPTSARNSFVQQWAASSISSTASSRAPLSSSPTGSSASVSHETKRLPTHTEMLDLDRTASAGSESSQTSHPLTPPTGAAPSALAKTSSFRSA